VFALLQLYPPEATVPFDGEADDGDSGVDVLAVDNSRDQLEQFAADYEQRHRTALDEWKAWDDLSRDWGAEHDCKCAELERKYHVRSPTIPGIRWQIVAVGTQEWPHSEQPAAA
jgi:hypothetical protein